MTIKVSIVGGSGYTGGELVRILLNHPNVEINQITSRQFAGKTLGRAHPNLRNIALRFGKLDIKKISDSDVVFLATPHGISMDLVAELIKNNNGVKIIDLSADFRIKNLENYEQWYGKHSHPELLQRFVYGIPELHSAEIKNANFVACAGCIATASILGLAPLKNFGINSAVINVSIGSSASGSGFNLSTHHPERANVIRIFSALKHRHQAEIEQETGIKIVMNVQAVDLVRGILVVANIQNFSQSLNELIQRYREFYGNSQFIRIVPSQIQSLPNPKNVLGSNYCDIGFVQENSNLVIFSAIDNLVKGAAGQAVQCMNLMFGFKEETGLEQLPLYPI